MTQTVVITGASAGIARATAQLLYGAPPGRGALAGWPVAPGCSATPGATTTPATSQRTGGRGEPGPAGPGSLCRTRRSGVLLLEGVLDLFTSLLEVALGL